MRDANMAGMLMIMIGAVLSVLTPTILLLLGLFAKPRFQLGACFLSCCISGVVYWVLSYLDLGKQLHQFIAA